MRGIGAGALILAAIIWAACLATLLGVFWNPYRTSQVAYPGGAKQIAPWFTVVTEVRYQKRPLAESVLLERWTAYAFEEDVDKVLTEQREVAERYIEQSKKDGGR